MERYAVLSVETHLYFARIMKEHSLFLMAGFPGKEKAWIETADWYREHFEDFLKEVLDVGEGLVRNEVRESCELTTKYTALAETRTQELSGIPIDCRITELEQNLKKDCYREVDRELLQRIRELNEKAVWLLDGLIDFKQGILDKVRKAKLFTGNYPLLVEHVMREAKLYRSAVSELLRNRQVSEGRLYGSEAFWNQIMMEHALFIRGLLDPGEVELVRAAHGFSREYRELLEQAKRQECRVAKEMESAMEKTKRFCTFKAAGTEGILECKIDSVILPLLADHVLREANHFIRILESGFVS